MDKSTTINERFVSLIGALNKNPNSFAKSIGKTYTAIESICKGRSKPGYDLLESILDSYPEVNPSWLLTGSEPMFRQDQVKATPSDNYLHEHLQTLEQNFARLAAQLETKDHQLESKDKQIEGLQRTVDALISRPATPATAGNFHKPATHEAGTVLPLHKKITLQVA